MSDGPLKSWVGKVRQVLVTLLMVAGGVRSHGSSRLRPCRCL